MEVLLKELAKVDSVVTKLASRYPENNAVWTGSISERLKIITDLMLEELNNERI